MKRFKYDWLVYGIVGLICLVLGILIMPPVAVIKADKLICGLIALTLIVYFAFYVYRKYDKVKKLPTEVLIVTIIQFVVIIYLITAAILLIFDINIIGNGIVNQIGRIIGILLWCHGLVNIIEEAHNRSRGRFGFIQIYISIILISLGCYCFFNINISRETIIWVLFGILMCVFLLGLIFFFVFKPKLTEEQKKAKADKKAEKQRLKAEKAAKENENKE